MSLRRLFIKPSTSLQDKLRTHTHLFVSLGLLSVLSVPMGAHAEVAFSYNDWQVACDNTLTCRLAGYQSENNGGMPVSVLLTRKAGKNAVTTGQVKLGGTKDSSAKALMQLGNRHRITMRLNGKDMGELRPTDESGASELSRTQVDALVKALRGSSTIEFVFRNSRWQLSDKGANAVMLKADDAQGRVGTNSAFIKPNANTSSNNVLSPRATPVLHKVKPSGKDNTRKFSIKTAELARIIKNGTKNADDTCPNLMDDSAWRINRLNSQQLLVQHSCWLGAYNAGTGMWVINDSKPYQPVMVTDAATSYDAGVISADQKGRGIGDCYSSTQWVWTGQRFEKSYESSTGMCRLVEAGGAWDLPTFVTQVKSMP